MKIYNGLLASDINAYSDEGAACKKAFHADGKKFLRDLAKELGLTGKCDIRSNLGGIAVSGEVMLQSDTLFVCIEEMTRGVKILYRQCRNRRDSTGGQNNWATIHELSHSETHREDFIERCKQFASAPVTA